MILETAGRRVRKVAQRELLSSIMHSPYKKYLGFSRFQHPRPHAPFFFSSFLSRNARSLLSITRTTLARERDNNPRREREREREKERQSVVVALFRNRKDIKKWRCLRSGDFEKMIVNGTRASVSRLFPRARASESSRRSKAGT